MLLGALLLALRQLRGRVRTGLLLLLGLLGGGGGGALEVAEADLGQVEALHAVLQGQRAGVEVSRGLFLGGALGVVVVH